MRNIIAYFFLKKFYFDYIINTKNKRFFPQLNSLKTLLHSHCAISFNFLLLKLPPRRRLKSGRVWEFIDCRNEILIKSAYGFMEHLSVRGKRLAFRNVHDKNLFALSEPEKHQRLTCVWKHTQIWHTCIVSFC